MRWGGWRARETWAIGSGKGARGHRRFSGQGHGQCQVLPNLPTPRHCGRSFVCRQTKLDLNIPFRPMPSTTFKECISRPLHQHSITLSINTGGTFLNGTVVRVRLTSGNPGREQRTIRGPSAVDGLQQLPVDTLDAAVLEPGRWAGQAPRGDGGERVGRPLQADDLLLELRPGWMGGPGRSQQRAKLPPLCRHAGAGDKKRERSSGNVAAGLRIAKRPPPSQYWRGPLPPPAQQGQCSVVCRRHSGEILRMRMIL